MQVRKLPTYKVDSNNNIVRHGSVKGATKPDDDPLSLQYPLFEPANSTQGFAEETEYTQVYRQSHDLKQSHTTKYVYSSTIHSFHSVDQI